MNPALFSLAMQATSETQMLDYIKLIGGIIIVLYIINKIGDLKMILYVLVIVAGFIITIYGVPGMENTAVYPLVVEFVNSIPGLLEEFMGKLGGII